MALGLAVALGLRLALADYSLWFDEWAALIFADQPMARLWSGWMARETNPPLFYALLGGWQALGFGGVVDLRLLPVLAGVAQIGVAGAIAARWHSWRAGVLVVWLLALSAQHVFASQLLRGYGFTMLGASLSLAGLLVWWWEGRRWGLALWAAGALLAIYCHTTLLLWPLVAGLGLLALRRREADRRWMIKFALAGLVVLAGAGWWLAISLEQVRGASGNIGWIAPLGLGPILAVETHYGFPARIVDFDDFPAYAITLTLLAAALWSGWRARLVRLAALLALLAVAVWWGCSWVHPVVTWGTVLWPMGLVALVLGCGLAQMPGWLGRVLPVLLLGVLALNLAQRAASLPTEDWRGALAQAAARPGTALVVEHEAMAVIARRACRQQFGAAGCPFALVVLASPAPSDSWAFGLGRDPLLGAAQVRARLAGFQRVYALHHAGYDPLPHLGLSGFAPRRNWHDPFVEGPLPGRLFSGNPPTRQPSHPAPIPGR